MPDETIAIYGGCPLDSTRPVESPINQTVAYDFIDAERTGPMCAIVPSVTSRI